jgi:WD40 repeat protein
VTSLAFSRNGDQLASGSTDRTAKLFSLPDGSRLRTFEGHNGHVLGVAWQADGSRLATAGGDSVIKIWETATGEQQRTIAGFDKEVTAVSFAGVTTELLAASGGSLVSLLQVNDGKTVRRFTGLGGFIQSLGTARGHFAAGTATGQLGGWQIAIAACLLCRSASWSPWRYREPGRAMP